ncbi:hypothetical protein PUR29_34815 [Methylobacterium ajmalii]|uniref:Uncharacterized protein n=1 Tax=Methylobacterium ajmalii TaxID=2738439 RepID=A0ABV0A793_9HYPH
MSTGLECLFREVAPGQWWYVLQDWSCPRGAWDWREYATAYGPFPNEEAADAHLRANHANPGGCNISPYQEGDVIDDVMARLMKEAA